MNIIAFRVIRENEHKSHLRKVRRHRIKKKLRLGSYYPFKFVLGFNWDSAGFFCGGGSRW